MPSLKCKDSQGNIKPVRVAAINVAQYPELDNPAATTDVTLGKQYIDEQGQKQTGTMVNPIPAKGFIFENYDADGYPTTFRFVGDWESIPNGMLAFAFRNETKNTFFGKNIKILEFPEGIVSIGDNSCSNNTGLSSITLPSTIQSLDKSSFYHCTALEAIVFNGFVPNIPNQCFMGNTMTELYDFSHHSGAIPSLYGGSALGHASGCIIKVPQALLAEWQTATNWVNLTDVTWQGV